jgi:hypothetical protein
MNLAINNIRPRNEQSLLCIVSVELPDAGLTIRNVGIHRGRDGRVWIDLPSKPVFDQAGKRRVPYMYFKASLVGDFERSVFEEAIRHGIITRENFLSNNQPPTSGERAADKGGSSHEREHQSEARQ